MRGAGVVVGVGEDEEVQEEEGVAVVVAGADKVVQVAQVEGKPICRRQITVNSCGSQRFE